MKPTYPTLVAAIALTLALLMQPSRCSAHVGRRPELADPWLGETFLRQSHRFALEVVSSTRRVTEVEVRWITPCNDVDDAYACEQAKRTTLFALATVEGAPSLIEGAACHPFVAGDGDRFRLHLPKPPAGSLVGVVFALDERCEQVVARATTFALEDEAPAPLPRGGPDAPSYREERGTVDSERDQLTPPTGKRSELLDLLYAFVALVAFYRSVRRALDS